MKPVEAIAQQTWDAALDLGFEARDGRTVLARRASRGPLAVQKMLYPEGDAVCHTILLHPPGGIAGGDRLSISISIGPGAHAVFATPGATKWYRSAALHSRQAVALEVGRGAVAEWLPQENIFFESVNAENLLSIDLGPEAVFYGWDVMCLGRTASGEQFARGRIRQRLSIRREGRPIFEESAGIEGGSAVLQSPAGLAGYPVYGTFLFAGPVVDGSLLQACRDSTADAGSRCAVTALPEVFVARYLGRSAEQARSYFSSLWERLRPAYAGREARKLRIWAT